VADLVAGGMQVQVVVLVGLEPEFKVIYNLIQHT
jgi:hypothetical protein